MECDETGSLAGFVVDDDESLYSTSSFDDSVSGDESLSAYESESCISGTTEDMGDYSDSEEEYDDDDDESGESSYDDEYEEESSDDEDIEVVADGAPSTRSRRGDGFVDSEEEYEEEEEYEDNL